MKVLTFFLILFLYSNCLAAEPASLTSQKGQNPFVTKILVPNTEIAPAKKIHELPSVKTVVKPVLMPAGKPASLNSEYKYLFTKKSIPAKPLITKTNNISNIIRASAISEQSNTLPVTKKAWQKPIIVIDPGHGGKDSGAIGKNGTWEKRITFAYSLALKEALERTGRYKVVLTRTRDVFVELPERVKAARRAGGSILLSIHADSHPNKDTRGFSVYTLSAQRAEKEYDKLLAQSNYQEVVRGVTLRGASLDVKQTILDFAQTETKSVSDDFAKVVAKHLGQTVQALPRTHREASLAVLTAADMPSALLELGYLSNAYEENLLNQKAHKEKIINSLKNAIDEYFKTHDYMI